MPQTFPDTFAAFGGLDSAEAKPDIGLQVTGPAKRECFPRAPTPEAIDAGGTTLRTRCSGPPMAICLARPHGPLVAAWHTDDLLVLFPSQPLTLARYREACTPSRATDAPTDAELPLALLLTHRNKLQRLQPQRPTRRALAQRVAHRRRLVGDTGRIPTRLPRALQTDCPPVLPWLQDKDPPLFWDVLRRRPPLQAAHLARRSTLAAFLRAQHVSGADGLAQRLPAGQTATPLTTAAGGSAPQALLGQARLRQRRVTWDASEAFEQARAPRAQGPPAFPLLQALPGAGPVVASRLLGACGE